MLYFLGIKPGMEDTRQTFDSSSQYTGSDTDVGILFKMASIFHIYCSFKTLVSELCLFLWNVSCGYMVSPDTAVLSLTLVVMLPVQSNLPL